MASTKGEKARVRAITCDCKQNLKNYASGASKGGSPEIIGRLCVSDIFGTPQRRSCHIGSGFVNDLSNSITQVIMKLQVAYSQCHGTPLALSTATNQGIPWSKADYLGALAARLAENKLEHQCCERRCVDGGKTIDLQ